MVLLIVKLWLQVCLMKDPPAPTQSIDGVPLEFVKFENFFAYGVRMI